LASTDPAADQKTLLKKFGEVIAEEAPDEISAGHEHAENAHAYDEARPAAAKELAEPTSRQFRAVTEEFVDGFPESAGSFGRPAGPSR
jgi:hypothetical protein